jgi:hypothetical protein
MEDNREKRQDRREAQTLTLTQAQSLTLTLTLTHDLLQCIRFLHAGNDFTILPLRQDSKANSSRQHRQSETKKNKTSVAKDLSFRVLISFSCMRHNLSCFKSRGEDKTTAAKFKRKQAASKKNKRKDNQQTRHYTHDNKNVHLLQGTCLLHFAFLFGIQVLILCL